MTLLLALTCAKFSMGFETTLDISYVLHKSIWYSHGKTTPDIGYPKYSGALGTYTAKHIPVAVAHKGVTYYTFSDCITENSQTYLAVYVADSLGNKTLVRKVLKFSWIPACDPHMNGVVNIIDGHVYVIAAARGNWYTGIAYRATKPNSIESFEEVARGFWAYPQLWSTALIYTSYENSVREPWVKNRFCEKKLVSGGHYNISYQDDKFLHLAYNYHENDNLDHRKNLYYMRSKDGCNWENINGVKLTLPVEPDSDLTKIMDSTGYMYLKDITTVNGVVKILCVDSTSFLPDDGTRQLILITKNNINYLAEVDHNYNTGGFIDGFIVTPTRSQEFGYAGGDLEIFDMSGNFIRSMNYRYTYNYVRKVVNGSGGVVSQTTSSSVKSNAYIRRLRIRN